MAKRILIVDDDIDDLILIEHELHNEGYDVSSTTDPEEGLRRARHDLPDLIVLDEVMPKLFGSEVSAKLRDDPRTMHIPIVFLTALKTPDDPATPASPNIVIAKSGNSAELLDAIAQRLVKNLFY
jgi:two-component system sensor histidine kinase/response regulator